jgi:hypothetical protein
VSTLLISDTDGRRLISFLYSSQLQHPQARIGLANQARIRQDLALILQNDKLSPCEAVILTLGDMGRHASDENMCEILEMLLINLGSDVAPLRSLAYTEVGLCPVQADL